MVTKKSSFRHNAAARVGVRNVPLDGAPAEAGESRIDAG
jgi:hypothetical protein